MLTVDLTALADNYRELCRVAGSSEVAGVVKADAYGLGLAPVVTTLRQSGCRVFFVAKLDEGLALRAQLPDVDVHVFDGLTPGGEDEFVAHRLIPVINSLDQLQRWQRVATASGGSDPLPTVVHVDTGMLRLGLTLADAATLAEEPHRREGLDVQMVMSHLASADEPGSDQSERQLSAFRNVRAMVPHGRASLANSAGVYRSPAFHFDLVRPGYALYGGHPQPHQGHGNPMKPVVTIEAPVLQIRSAQPGETVGYGASHRFDQPARLATIGVGYADGFLRSGSNRGAFVLDGQSLPVVGRVSMDLVTVDITACGCDIEEGAMVEVIGPDRTIDAVAAAAGTIGYEVLTSLGNRYRRRYLGLEEETGRAGR